MKFNDQVKFAKIICIGKRDIFLQKADFVVYI